MCLFILNAIGSYLFWVCGIFKIESQFLKPKFQLLKYYYNNVFFFNTVFNIFSDYKISINPITPYSIIYACNNLSWPTEN